jgi:hypothetical protein
MAITEGGRANQGGGGVDQAAAYRLRLVAAEGSTGADGWRRGRRQGRLELASERGCESAGRSAEPIWSG